MPSSDSTLPPRTTRRFGLLPSTNSGRLADPYKESWYIDLKEEGKVGKGEKQADVRLVMKDEIFQQLAEGKASAQYIPLWMHSDTCDRSLFMSGKFKVIIPFLARTNACLDQRSTSFPTALFTANLCRMSCSL
jgi:SCP-2 sterol transfer family